MDLTDKIKMILAIKNLSPSIFADEIGVQRPSISHILAGRNKPSLDIVQKIVKRFPDLGLNWILDDEELMLESDEITSSSSERYAPKSPQKNMVQTAPELNRRLDSEPTPVYENLNALPGAIKTEKKVERIMLFYSDGTYQEFKQ
ncbi:helix-turn-helix transcriptional regulator [Dyadobacter helix]|nr:helix-turn-helix transcriptional regulator [Dyadobacter sp. CECT 9275]